MSLIACPECTKEVSTLAESCPHCGAPIKTASDVQAAGTQLRTVQQTSKRLKIHILVSAILFWGGLVFQYLSIQKISEGGSQSGLTPALTTLPILAGFVWYIVTKARIWWHHK